VRTTKGPKPQQGITFLLIDMATPGIEVRPVIALTGEHIQNQIFFSDVRVPKANAVGKIDAGWHVAKHVLEFERGGSAYAPELQARLDEIRDFAAASPGTSSQRLIDDALFAAKLAATSIRVSALEIYELRLMSRLANGGTPGPAASVVKILGTELQQQVTELAMEVAGPYGRAFQPAAARPGGPVSLPHSKGSHLGSLEAVLAPLRYLNARAASIYAGSNEIQRNILAKTELGL
jgi:alkylation response protein AidB-like acyl-CoA dehydrogenase